MSGVSMIRFLPARHYLSFGIIGLFLAVFSGWLGLNWTPAFLPGGLFLVTSIVLILLAYWPGIEVHPHHLVLGSRIIHWVDIRRVDRTRFLSPLIIRLTLFDDSQALVIYPGDPEACRNLLRHVRRASRDALIDGVPYRQYWGEAATDSKQRPIQPRTRLLRAEDEAEVERLYQRLKAVGHLDPKSQQDEK
jgi:hypothetical protein